MNEESLLGRHAVALLTYCVGGIGGHRDVASLLTYEVGQRAAQG